MILMTSEKPKSGVKYSWRLVIIHQLINENTSSWSPSGRSVDAIPITAKSLASKGLSDKEHSSFLGRMSMSPQGPAVPHQVPCRTVSANRQRTAAVLRRSNGDKVRVKKAWTRLYFSFPPAGRTSTQKIATTKYCSERERAKRLSVCRWCCHLSVVLSAEEEEERKVSHS